jgi:hypothetical protein
MPVTARRVKKKGSENLLRSFDGGARLWVVLACSKLQVNRVIEASKAASNAVALEGGARQGQRFD